MKLRDKNRSVINDIILIIVIILIAVIFFAVQAIFSKDGGKAVVMCNGEILYELPLNKDMTGESALRIETDNGYNILEICDGVATVTVADCPDGLCVKQNAVSKQGESIICLPHKLVITIEGTADKTDIDTFVY